MTDPEAATEIERLAKLNEEYHEKLGDVVAEAYRMKLLNDRLSARIAVLEGALEEIASIPGKTLERCDDPSFVIEIAREALNTKDG